MVRLLMRDAEARQHRGFDPRTTTNQPAHSLMSFLCFHRHVTQQGFSKNGKDAPIPPGAYNLSDLKVLGQTNGWCPYFLARYTVGLCGAAVLSLDHTCQPCCVQLPLSARPEDCRDGVTRDFEGIRCSV
jgi:hypothetical protein